MANVYATKTGNWSDTTVWNTGALPTSSDDVYSNTYTVTIDQDVTVVSLRNASATGISAGGGFALSHASGTTRNVTATFVSSNAILLTISSTGTTNLTGSITGNGNALAVSITGAATVTCVGTITPGASASTYTLRIDAAATVTITGNVTGAGTNTAIISGVAGVTLTITGNCTGGSGVGGNAVFPFAAVTLNVTGTITGAGCTAIGRSSNAAMTWTFTGPFICGSTGIAPYSPGDLTIVKLSQITNNEFRFKDATSGTASLWSSDVNTGAPTAANVRYGTRYGATNEFTGTCQVPAAASVLYGVPVDNTTGTASLTNDPQLTPL